jgi:hypothetical protein
MNNKQTDLKFRYAQGLGDIVACFLHSKPIGWFTHLITGTDKPCNECSIRRNALNTLAPIPFWKLFFENKEEALLSITEDYKNNGYEVDLDINKLSMSASKVDKVEQPLPIIQEPEPPINSDDLSDYRLLNTSINKYDNILIKTEVYKKRD